MTRPQDGKCDGDCEQKSASETPQHSKGEIIIAKFKSSLAQYVTEDCGDPHAVYDDPFGKERSFAVYSAAWAELSEYVAKLETERAEADSRRKENEK